MKFFLSLLALLIAHSMHAQTNTYTVSFENAVHHQALIKANFPDLGSQPLSLPMGSFSLGRYALLEIANNLYGYKATDSKGKALKVYRPNHNQLEVSEHDGQVNIAYILFTHRGDSTYAQIELT